MIIQRKTTFVRFCILICIGALFISLCTIMFPQKRIIVYAVESSQKSEEAGLEENIREQIEELDFSELQEYFDTIEGFAGTTVADRLLQYIKGANVNYSSLGKELLLVLFSQITEIAPSFACIMSIALLLGLLSMLKSTVPGDTMSEMMNIIAYAGVLIPLTAVLTACLSKTLNGIESMNKQMKVVFPIMLTLLTVCGSGVTSAVCKTSVGFFSTTICTLLTDVVFPLTIVIIVFSMAGNFTKELKIGKFTALFKSLNKWIIGLSISIFGLFFTLQGITASVYDGMVRRAAKYAIGNGIPIVGGFLSNGFDLAVAGSILIKNSLGSMGIFLMLAVLFEPLILLIATTILLRLTSAVTQSLGNGKVSDVLGETADNLHYCTACLLFVAFLYFLSIMIMVYCTEALL